MRLKIFATSLVFASTCTWALACDNSESSASLQSKLSVVDATFHINQDNDPATIAAIGTIKNPTGACANDLVVEVKYFNAAGALVDVHTESLFGISVPAGQEVAFRVRGPADQAKESYAKVVVRVASVDTQYVQEPKEKRSAILDALYWWWPLLLLIGLVELILRRQVGKNSPQQKMLQAVQHQMPILERQTTALERIADSLEKKG